MRTTLNIAEDVLRAAKERARREKKTAGAVISELARHPLTAPLREPAVTTHKARFGFRPFPSRGVVVSNELIDRLREGDAY